MDMPPPPPPLPPHLDLSHSLDHTHAPSLGSPDSPASPLASVGPFPPRYLPPPAGCEVDKEVKLDETRPLKHECMICASIDYYSGLGRRRPSPQARTATCSRPHLPRESTTAATVIYWSPLRESTPGSCVFKPPWLPPGLDESFAGFRDNAITRYKEKNKRRKIRSDSHGAYVSQWAHVRRDTTSTSDVLAAEFLQKDARLAV